MNLQIVLDKVAFTKSPPTGTVKARMIRGGENHVEEVPVSSACSSIQCVYDRTGGHGVWHWHDD
ncbi:hypothetical protein BFO01nite_07460 [Brevibacillus formosus]|uniref:Uncharacterized protein n=1 Tax=Brevibacillus formosus TaxID=54913 RepID=A0ABQ0T280_9BACL|nr:hypothetical protein BFO01nite_07460 [Brevibacillus formosus]